MGYIYRIIATNPDTVSEQFVVQGSYEGGPWAEVYTRSTLSEASRLYDELIAENTRTYGYKIIKSQ